MIAFTSVNNFSTKKFKFGLNFEIQNNTTNFITANEKETYQDLFKTIIKPRKDVIGQIHFDRYELINMDYKMRSRFIYGQLEIFTDDIFYNQNLTVYEFLKENWMLNHFNTKDFDDFFKNFIDETKFDRWDKYAIKHLSNEQKIILGLSLSLFNNKKYLLINKEIEQLNYLNYDEIFKFTNFLNQKNITILWFCDTKFINIENNNLINIDEVQYDCLNKKFIVNDDVFLSSKFSLTLKKWFKLTTTFFTRVNIFISLLYGVVSTTLFMLSLFFANKPISLFNKNIGIIKDDETCLLIGVILLIVLLLITIFYSLYLFKRSKRFLRLLSFSGVQRITLNFLICFIILVFACSVILSSYIILLITYSSFGFLDKVKWVSSIYFPISLLFFNVTCCVMCSNMIKNNLLETKVSRLKHITMKRNKTQKEENYYGKKI